VTQQFSPEKPVAVNTVAEHARVEHQKITRSATIVAGGTLASRLLGLVRDQVIAAVFARSATDAFFVAFTIPNVLRQLVAEGAVQNAVLPVLGGIRERNGEEAARAAHAKLRGFSLLVLLGLTFLGFLFADPLVGLFAAGYHQIPGQFERTVRLTKLLFPYIFFMGTAALGMAALNLCRKFAVSSLAPGLLNVAFVICGLTLPAWFQSRNQDPVYALAVAVLVGGALQVIAQWPTLRSIGYFGWPSFRFRDPVIRETVRRMGPVLIGIGIYYVDVVLARRFLSNLSVGSQSYFSWAMRLCDFPQGIFVMALQSASLPSLSRMIARGDRDVAADTFSHGMRLTLWITVATTVGAVGLAEPIVTLVFQRGTFDATASHETARAFIAQALGIWAVAAVRQLVAVYYALGDTRTPVKVAALDLIAFILAALLLSPRFGHVGVGAAVSIASFAQMVLLWVGLRGRLPTLHLKDTLKTVVTSLVLASIAIVIAKLVMGLATSWYSTGWAHRVLPGLFACAAFGIVFLSLARLLRSPELASLRRSRHS
jgi:putative peptidoglycan lipid II flippase